MAKPALTLLLLQRDAFLWRKADVMDLSRLISQENREVFECTFYDRSYPN